MCMGGILPSTISDVETRTVRNAPTTSARWTKSHSILGQPGLGRWQGQRFDQPRAIQRRASRGRPREESRRKLGNQWPICGKAPLGFEEVRTPVASRGIEECIEKLATNIKAEIRACVRLVPLLRLTVKANDRRSLQRREKLGIGLGLLEPLSPFRGCIPDVCPGRHQAPRVQICRASTSSYDKWRTVLAVGVLQSDLAISESE